MGRGEGKAKIGKKGLGARAKTGYEKAQRIAKDRRFLTAKDPKYAKKDHLGRSGEMAFAASIVASSGTPAAGECYPYPRAQAERRFPTGFGRPTASMVRPAPEPPGEKCIKGCLIVSV